MIEHHIHNNGIECCGASEIEQAMKAAEADGENGGASTEVARGPHDGQNVEEQTLRWMRLHVSLPKKFLGECSKAYTIRTSLAKAQVARPAVTH